MGKAPRLVAALAVVAVLLSAVPVAVLANAATHPVNLQNAQFAPKNLTIAKGDTVTWTNLDSYEHDVTFEAGFGSGAAGSLQASATWSHTFNDTGTFKYRCQLHSSDFDNGMVGAVTVIDNATTAPPPPPPRTPGFELAGALLAIGAVASLSLALRRHKTE